MKETKFKDLVSYRLTKDYMSLIDFQKIFAGQVQEMEHLSLSSSIWLQ